MKRLIFLLVLLFINASGLAAHGSTGEGSIEEPLGLRGEINAWSWTVDLSPRELNDRHAKLERYYNELTPGIGARMRELLHELSPLQRQESLRSWVHVFPPQWDAEIETPSKRYLFANLRHIETFFSTGENTERALSLVRLISPLVHLSDVPEAPQENELFDLQEICDTWNRNPVFFETHAPAFIPLLAVAEATSPPALRLSFLSYLALRPPKDYPDLEVLYQTISPYVPLDAPLLEDKDPQDNVGWKAMTIEYLSPENRTPGFLALFQAVASLHHSGVAAPYLSLIRLVPPCLRAAVAAELQLLIGAGSPFSYGALKKILTHKIGRSA